MKNRPTDVRALSRIRVDDPRTPPEGRPTDVRALSRIRVADPRTPPEGRPTDVRALSRIRVAEDEHKADDGEGSRPKRRRAIAELVDERDARRLDQAGDDRDNEKTAGKRRRSIQELAQLPIH